MTQLKVDTITDAAGTAAPDLEDGLTINGAALSTVNTAEYYSSGTEPSSPKDGAIWWDTANDKVMIYVNDAWYEVTLVGSASSAVWYGDRAVIFGGNNSTNNPTNEIQYFDITTTGNSSDFGDLANTGAWGLGSVSNATYGVHHNFSSSSSYTALEYVTISTTGNAQSFGTLTSAEDRGASASDGTTGLFNSNSVFNQITIATTANATSSSASLTVSRDDHGAAGNTNRAVFAGAYVSSNIMDYVTWASLGAGVDFGDLTQARGMMGALSNATYSVFGGGTTGSPTNTIDYVTIDTTGNATDFGDLTTGRMRSGAAANGTRGTFSGGADNSAATNIIDYITIASPGNATDHGDLISSKDKSSGASGAAS